MNESNNKRSILLLIVLCSVAFTTPAFSENKLRYYELEDAMQSYQNSKYFVDGVKLYFGDQPTPNVIEKLKVKEITLRTARRGKDKTGRLSHTIKTKEEKEAVDQKRYQRICRYLFSSVIGRLANEAKSDGANAIVNITNRFKGGLYKNELDFECVQGYTTTALSFEGVFVKVE